MPGGTPSLSIGAFGVTRVHLTGRAHSVPWRLIRKACE
jgi:hypothetical protein